MSKHAARTGRSPAPAHRIQSLVILLAGITADDYLAWVRDPEPSALGDDLTSITTDAEPLRALVTVELIWNGQPLTTPSVATVIAGFPMTPEVAAVFSTHIAQSPSSERHGG
jgi:hypothetical protein